MDELFFWVTQSTRYETCFPTFRGNPLTNGKLTINLAFGGNSALESTAAFVNLLHREVKAHPDRKMSQETISTIFEEYQNQRKPRMKKVLNLAYQMTRLQAWDGWFMKFIQRWIIPLVGDGKVADHFAELVKGGHRLDFVPVPPHREGWIPFNDEKEEVPGTGMPPPKLPLEIRKAPPNFGSVIRQVLMPWIVLSSAALLGVFYQFTSVRAEDTSRQ